MMIHEPVTDEALLLAARTDAEAFTQFYRRQRPRCSAISCGATRDPELGADLTAETFACVLEGLARFDPDRGSALNWLFGIARHQLLRAIERGHVERRARDKMGVGRIELDDDELDRILVLAESESTAVQLADAIDALPPDQQAALNARVLEEQEYDAIARSSGTAEATIRKRVSRALDSLRNALGENR